MKTVLLFAILVLATKAATDLDHCSCDAGKYLDTEEMRCKDNPTEPAGCSHFEVRYPDGTTKTVTCMGCVSGK